MEILKFRFALRDHESMFEITADSITEGRGIFTGIPCIQLNNAEMFVYEDGAKKNFTPENHFSVGAVANDIIERISRNEHVAEGKRSFGLIEVVFAHETIKKFCEQFNETVDILGHKVPRKVLYCGQFAVLFAATEYGLYYTDIAEPFLVRFDGTIIGDVGEMVEGAFLGDREEGLIIWEDQDYERKIHEYYEMAWGSVHAQNPTSQPASGPDNFETIEDTGDLPF